MSTGLTARWHGKFDSIWVATNSSERLVFSVKNQINDHNNNNNNNNNDDIIILT